MSWHYLSNMVVVLLLISLAWSEVRVEMALALMDFQRIIGVKKIWNNLFLVQGPWGKLFKFNKKNYLDGGFFRCLGGVASIAGILIDVSLWLRRLLDEDFLEAPSEPSGLIGWSWSWSLDNAVLDGESGFSEVLALDLFFFDFSIFSPSLFQLFQTV